MAEFKGKLSIPSRGALPSKALPRKRKTTATTTEDEPTSFPESLCWRGERPWLGLGTYFCSSHWYILTRNRGKAVGWPQNQMRCDSFLRNDDRAYTATPPKTGIQKIPQILADTWPDPTRVCPRWQCRPWERGWRTNLAISLEKLKGRNRDRL